jgi:hypothetical protein
MAAWAALLGLACGTAQARTVVLNIDLPLDQAAAGQPAKVGEHHSARIFYDDATVDSRTHVTRVLQMQHLDGNQWKPQTLDPNGMPMIDAWLDLGAKPYRYHYRAALTMQGTPVIVEFDDVSRRFSIVLQKDLSVLISAPYTVDSVPASGVDAASALRPPPAYIGLNLYVTLEQVAAGEGGQIGNVAWLDLSSAPYRLHYRAQVTHGKPMLIEIDENTRRLTIRDQHPPGAVLISGPYGFDSVPVTGPEAAAAAEIPVDGASRQ